MTAHAITYTNFVIDVPKEKASPAYRLFHHRYRCAIQQIFLLDAGVMEKWGAPTSGDAARDKEQLNAWVEVRPTPVEMCQFLQNGAAIQFHDDRTATEVYLDLVAHLRAWISAFESNPNLRHAPLEDLRVFDELAAAIYPYANANLMSNEDDAGYGAYLARNSRRSSGLMSRNRAALAEKQTVTGIRSIYRPLSEAVAEKLAKRLKA
jgi:hypothetical protein